MCQGLLGHPVVYQFFGRLADLLVCEPVHAAHQKIDNYPYISQTFPIYFPEIVVKPIYLIIRQGGWLLIKHSTMHSGFKIGVGWH
jgi:hypothetical protein